MSPVLVAAILVIISIFLYQKYKENKTLTKNYPPGPIRLPFVGSYLQLLWIDFYRPAVALAKLKDYYRSSVISFGMGNFNIVVANDYESCKQVFDKPELQGRPLAYPGLLRTFGEKNGFFGDDGPRWLHLRRKTLQAMRDFGFGRRSELFEGVVAEEALTLVDILNATNGEPTLAPEVFFYTFFNLINHLVHGFRVPLKDRATLTNLGKIARGIITSTDATGRLLAIWPWLRFLFPGASGYDRLVQTSRDFEAYVRSSYNRHQQDLDENAIRDLLDFFLINKSQFEGWTDEELLTATMDLMFPNAAVAVVLTFTLAFLCNHPEKLKKCQQEIDEVVGRGRLPTLDDRQSLKIVEMSIRETMRIEPLTPMGLTHRATEDTTLGRYHVPQDSLVITNFWAMNQDPNHWGDPENFRPERFLEDKVKDTSFPFGLGKRVCAGETFARQNLFIALATILQNFDLKVATPLDPNRYVTGLAVTPNEDFSLRFIARS